MRRARIVGLVAAAAAIGSTALAGVAEAKPFGERFHEEFSDVVDDFCGEPGLTVQFDRSSTAGSRAVRVARTG